MTVSSRVMLLAIAAFLGALHVRLSVATWEARSTFLFVPFQLRPCSNIIKLASYGDRNGLSRDDVLLAVNGRPYSGEAVYRQELRSAGRYLDSINHLPAKEFADAFSRWPFRVTVQSGAAAPRAIDVYFANCTCGSLSMRQVVWYCILPPAVALLAGLFVAGRRPRSAAAWLFLAATVCLAQVAIVPEWSSRWSQVGDPREWQDWFRVPTMAYQAFFRASWPAWMVLFAVYCFRERPNRRLVWSAVAPILVFAAIKAVVAVGASENFQAVAGLETWLRTSSTEIAVLSMGWAAITSWGLGRVAAGASTVLAGSAAVLLYWPARIPNSWVVWSDGNLTEPALPAFHRGLNLVGPVFAASLVLVIAVVGWKDLRSRTSGIAAASAALSVTLILVPFLYEAFSTEWALWWTKHVPQALLGCLYAGLIGAAWSVLRASPRVE